MPEQDLKINTTENNTTIGGDFKPTVDTEDYDKLKKDLIKLKNDFEDEKEKIKMIGIGVERSKYDLVTLLGVFVGIITYLGLEIQVFKTINNPLVIVGISFFFIASILLFVLTINLILKNETVDWKCFKNPLYCILSFLLILSISFIIIGYCDFKNQENSQYNLYEN